MDKSIGKRLRFTTPHAGDFIMLHVEQGSTWEIQAARIPGSMVSVTPDIKGEFFQVEEVVPTGAYYPRMYLIPEDRLSVDAGGNISVRGEPYHYVQ